MIKKDNALAEFSSRPRFYSLFEINSIASTVEFYTDILGCKLINQTDSVVELDFFGNYISGSVRAKKYSDEKCAVSAGFSKRASFGLLMSWEDWNRAVDHMNYIGVKFFLEPTVNQDDKKKEYAIFLLEDPSGNILEFKSEVS
jgi:uncharacterized protein